MKIIKLNKSQKIKLLEMCEDLFPEYCDFRIDEDTMFYTKNNSKVLVESIPWFELCILEMPKRIAENSSTMLPKITEYKIYESMSKRFLNIHPTYEKITPRHPVDYLYEEYKKI